MVDAIDEVEEVDVVTAGNPAALVCNLEDAADVNGRAGVASCCEEESSGSKFMADANKAEVCHEASCSWWVVYRPQGYVEPHNCQLYPDMRVTGVRRCDSRLKRSKWLRAHACRCD